MDWTNVAAGAAQWLPNSNDSGVDPNELAFHKAMSQRAGADLPDDVIIQAIKQRDNPDAAQSTPWSTPQAYSSQTVGGTESETFGPPTGQPDTSAMGNYKAKYSPEQFAQLLQDIQTKQKKRSPAQQVGNVAAGFLGGFRGLEAAKAMDKDRANKEFGDLWRFKEQSAYGEEMGRRGREEESRQDAKITAAQLKDPKSAQSRSAYEAVSVLVSTDPAMAARIAAIPEDQRTAVQLLAAFPAYKEAIKNSIELEKNRETVRGRIQASEDRSADRESQNATMLAIAGMPSRNNIQPGAVEGIEPKPSNSLLAKDQRWVQKGDRWVAEVIPGTKEDAKQRGLYVDSAADVTKIENTAKSIKDTIDYLLDIKNEDGFESQFGGYNALVTQYAPTGKAQDARLKVQQLKNLFKTAGLNELKTGSGGIGAITEKEWPILGQQIAAISPNMSEEEAKQVLTEVKNRMDRMVTQAKTKFDTEWEGTPYYNSKPDGDKPTPDKPTDVDIARAKKYGITPEEAMNTRLGKQQYG